MAYAQESDRADQAMPLFAEREVDRRMRTMSKTIDEIEEAMQKLGKGSPWGKGMKVSDDFLEPLFKLYFKRLKLPNLMAKKHFYELVKYVPEEEISPEISEKLDAISEVAKSAKSKA